MFGRRASRLAPPRPVAVPTARAPSPCETRPCLPPARPRRTPSCGLASRATRPLPRRAIIARGGSPPRCATCHPPPSKPKHLCVPIHPVPSLFVSLCVKNTRPRPLDSAPAYTPIPEQKFRLTEIQKIGSIFTRFYGTLAQLVEHVTFNHRVAGSIPAHPTIC